VTSVTRDQFGHFPAWFLKLGSDKLDDSRWRWSIFKPRLGLVCLLCCLTGCHDSAAPSSDLSEFVALRRAWQPGERDSTIAFIEGSGGFGQYSSLAPQIYADTDSVSVIVPNPALNASVGSALPLAPRSPAAEQFNSGWNITGIDVHIVDKTQSPADTIHWLGMFWSNPADATNKGFILVAAPARDSVVAATFVNTPAFDASGETSGAGGGEVQGTTYWEAEGVGHGANNKFSVTAAHYGSPTTVTSGPWTGGTTRSGTMSGNSKKVQLDRQSGTALPTSQTVDFGFNNMQAIQFTCVFPSPCTSAAAGAVVTAARSGDPAAIARALLAAAVSAPPAPASDDPVPPSSPAGGR